NRSDGLMGLAIMRTRTCLGPGSGTGRSRSWRTSTGSPKRSNTIAFMGVSPVQEVREPYSLGAELPGTIETGSTQFAARAGASLLEDFYGARRAQQALGWSSGPCPTSFAGRSPHANQGRVADIYCKKRRFFGKVLVDIPGLPL